jgi:hypothetical protein
VEREVKSIVKVEHAIQGDKDKVEHAIQHLVCLNLSARLISYDTVFFSHNKTLSASLSAAKTIGQTSVFSRED